MKVNRAGEIESKLQVNLEEILILSQISQISRIWSLGRLLVLESKFGGNIRVNILYLTRGWEPWAALGFGK